MTINFEKVDSSYAVAGVAGLVLSSVLLKTTLFRPATKKDPQVVLVTGASSGIGKATALQLLADGHIVYGAARRVDLMRDLLLVDNGHAVGLDVCNEAQIVAAVAQIVNEQGRIDVLINNAGYAVYGSVEDISMADARRQFDVNLFGLARMTQEVLPHMRKQKSGTIINVSSMGGKIYTPFGAWYHASKHALEGWSDCLRLELKGFGIKVVIMEPGAIATEFGDVLMGPLKKRSKGGAYESLVEKFAENGEKSQSMMSPPSVIANAMSDAVVRKNPPRRYLVGALAKPLVFVRGWLGDGIYDFFMMANLK